MRPLSALALLTLATSTASRAIHGPHRSATTTSLLPVLHLRNLLVNDTNNSGLVAATDDSDPEDEWELESDPEEEEDDEAPPLVPSTPQDPELTPEQKDALWCKFKSRGYQLTKAMMMNDQDAANLLAWPYIQSPWDGDLRNELRKWGYKDDFEGSNAIDNQCDFKKQHEMTDTFKEIGVDTRSAGQGGPNHCFYVTHNDGPIVHRNEDGELPYHDEQYYPVDGKDYRVCQLSFQSYDGGVKC